MICSPDPRHRYKSSIFSIQSKNHLVRKRHIPDRCHVVKCEFYACIIVFLPLKKKGEIPGEA